MIKLKSGRDAAPATGLSLKESAASKKITEQPTRKTAADRFQNVDQLFRQLDRNLAHRIEAA